MVSGMTWQPTWRRLIASTLVCFALVLALLAWRMQTGEDPALGSSASGTLTATSTSASDDEDDDDTSWFGGGDDDESSSSGSAVPSTGAS